MEDPKSGKLQMLRVYSLDDLNSLPSGLWGIREPDRLQQNSQALREDGSFFSLGGEVCISAKHMFVQLKTQFQKGLT